VRARVIRIAAFYLVSVGLVVTPILIIGSCTGLNAKTALDAVTGCAPSEVATADAIVSAVDVGAPAWRQDLGAALSALGSVGCVLDRLEVAQATPGHTAEAAPVSYGALLRRMEAITIVRSRIH